MLADSSATGGAEEGQRGEQRPGEEGGKHEL